MTELKRYVAAIEFYVWAENDEEAVKQLKKKAVEQSKQNDDRCSALSLCEQKFGTIGNREIKL